MASFTQTNRLLAIETPLGPDAFLLVGFSGTEALSEMFYYQLELLSANEEVTAKELVGQPVTWSVSPEQGNPRFFNGFVTQFSGGGRSLYDLRAYRLGVVPWLWFLTRTTDCRIFQNQTVPEIIAAIFDGLDFKDYEIKLGGAYSPREYCVQYRETAFHFVSRLMEDEGIFYFFRHEKDKHTLVIADRSSAYVDCPENQVKVSDGSLTGSHITTWDHRFEFRSGKMAHRDYNFETPSIDLLASTTTLIEQPGADAYELFDYPGEYKVRDAGDARIKLRMEEEEASYDVATGESNCSTFTPGGKFTLEEHSIKAEAGKGYVITSVKHSGSDTSCAADSGHAMYRNTFRCIPDAVAYRPQRTTPRPVVQGVQTAVVVGPPDEEIYTDKHSRIKVQFHWDRLGQFNENSSCWIRVSTIWAGKGFGIINIPRVGQEVVVDFLEGNPDQPLVVGSVFNAEQTPPTGLPKAKMVGGLRSNSYPGGGGYNGLTFDDTKGKEVVNLHAQYDMTTTVEHDDTQTVHNNRTITVDGTHTETIQQDTTIAITEGKLVHDVVANTATYHVKGDLVEIYESNQATSVGDNQATSVQNTISIVSEKADIHIQAATKIEIVVGKSSLVMDSAGNIDLKGVNITINGSDNIVLDSAKIAITGGKEAMMGVGAQNVTCDQSKVATSGAAINASAVGVHEITGAVVKIN